ncbi:hypothetical protein ACFQV8_18845 [Pseudonocardia benzenivorans]
MRVDGGRARFTDADGAELEVPALRAFGPTVGATPLLLDAELVGNPRRDAVLWIGDLLHLDGRDTLDVPFADRLALLEGLELVGPAWRPAPAYRDAGQAVVDAAAEQGLPFVVAKRGDSPTGPAGAATTGSRWRRRRPHPPPAGTAPRRPRGRGGATVSAARG